MFVLLIAQFRVSLFRVVSCVFVDKIFPSETQLKTALKPPPVFPFPEKSFRSRKRISDAAAVRARRTRVCARNV